MGLLKQIWWLLGALMAAPLVFPGIGKLIDGSYTWGVLFLVLGLLVLLAPEYLRWQLLDGDSVFERVPMIGSRGKSSEE